MNHKTYIDHNSVSYVVANTGQLIYLAKRLCHDVYLRSGYISEAMPDGIIPFQYDSSAVYIVALNAGNDVVGTVRLAMACPSHIFEVWQGKLYESYNWLVGNATTAKSFEMGALAVRPDFSYTGVSFGLYKAAYDYSLEQGLDYAIIGMDQRALGSLIKYGWNFIQIGEPPSS